MILTGRDTLLAVTAALASLAGAAWAQSSQPQEAPRISGEEALKLVTKGEAVVVDVRQKPAWEGSHADGAISMPLAEVGKRLSELPKDKLIAAYCT